MEIDITRFFKQEDANTFSGSVATHGENVGKETYGRACEAFERYKDLLDTDDKKAAFKAHIKGYGAWSEEEVNGWSDAELTGLFIQLISSEMKEHGLNVCEPDWEAYEADDNGGYIYHDPSDDTVYFSLD